jgi:hypothetical protein
MNVLLWRSEFGHREIGSAIPSEIVWEKVLTAPDNSSLNIFQNGKKIGYCRWSPNVGEERETGKISSDEFSPEGMVQELSSYTIDLEGNINVRSLTNNIRFDLSIHLSTNQTWQDFDLRVSMRPDSWEISSKASEEKLQLVVNDENGTWEQSFTFADLQNPDKILKEFGGPMAVAFVAGMGMKPTQKNQKMSLGLTWEAHNDWMKFGHSKVRVYRLEAKVLDRFKIFIFVSRVGEILWVHLPNEVVMSNDEFEHF